ncbi:MAG: alpha/beta fold hydrolase, partial [Acidobacteria bacterium]|nr:alpha/beta fold hydrolase [Acidobacteriota bacterium]
MICKRLRAAVALVASCVALGGCSLSANVVPEGPYARLGPPEEPVRLFVEEKGEGKPVLLIHGFGASTFTWRGVAPELAQDNHVIAVDLKGFGQSDKPLDERYAASDQAALLAQLIEARDLRDLTLVGHSYGGGIALLLV